MFAIQRRCQSCAWELRKEACSLSPDRGSWQGASCHTGTPPRPRGPATQRLLPSTAAQSAGLSAACVPTSQNHFVLLLCFPQPNGAKCVPIRDRGFLVQVGAQHPPAVGGGHHVALSAPPHSLPALPPDHRVRGAADPRAQRALRGVRRAARLPERAHAQGKRPWGGRGERELPGKGEGEHAVEESCTDGKCSMLGRLFNR